MTNTTHCFDIEDAVKYGVNAAILLVHIRFWISKNKANGKHFEDGRTWTYCSVKAYQKLFPYLGKSQINTALYKLVKAGVIVIGNYNKTNYDRTKWYALNDESGLLKHDIPFPKIGNGNGQNRKPIPDINTDINKKVNQKDVSNAPSFSFSSNDMKIAEKLHSQILEINPNFRKPNLESWANDVRIMVSRDKIMHIQIINVLDWVDRNEFWRKNILSIKKLRKQWDTLLTSMYAENMKNTEEKEWWRNGI